jgi:hypothetical protein
MSEQLEPIAKVEFFEFLNIFFTDKNRYARLTDSAKTQHMWGLFRCLAIHYPQEMQLINNVRDVTVIDALHSAMCSKSAPNWIYTKTPKAEPTALDAIDEKSRLELCNKWNIEYKQFNDMYAMFPAYVISEFKGLSELHKQPDKVKSKRKKTT